MGSKRLPDQILSLRSSVIFVKKNENPRYPSNSARLQTAVRRLQTFLPRRGYKFPFTFCLETKSNKKFKATKIPPAQPDRLTNATLASKTALYLLHFFLSWCGFSNRLPTSVRKSLQTFTLFRLVCGLSQRTCAGKQLSNPIPKHMDFVKYI